MPGIKRKATFGAPYQRPIKLKKQSTSVSVERAISTLKKAKSAPKSPVKLLKSASLLPRKTSPQKTIKKPLPLPRFPTLKPTKPSDPDALPTLLFYGNSPSTSFTKLKKAPTLLINEETVTPATKHLSKKSVSKLSVKSLSKKTAAKGNASNESSKDSSSEGTITSSGMNSSLRKLASGSLIGKIIKDDGLDSFLPSDTSLAVYEFSEDQALSPALNLSKTLNTPAARQSAYDVASFFASESPSKDEDEGKSANTNIESSSNVDSDSNESRESPSSSMDTSVQSIDSDPSPVQPTDSPLKEGENSTKSPKKGLRGGVREIVFSFDTTGSMYSYMEETREKIKDIVNKLQTDIPGIRLGFLAHGDYYDLQFDRYLIKWINFGASVDEISEFFEDLGITHGGDPEECYELVLRRVQDPNYVAWTPGSQRCLVMIGDSDPHEPGYTFEGKVNEIDWRQETEKLKEMGVRIYGLQVGYGSDFYRQISKTTGGAHLRLDTASLMPDVIMALCLREGNLKLLKHYESEVRSRAKKEGSSVDLELERLFSALKNIEDNKAFKLNKKTPSKSSTKKVKITSETKDEKKIQAVKRTLTPFLSAANKKPKLEKSQVASEDKTKTVESKESTPKVKSVVSKSLKEVKKTTPSPKPKTLKVSGKTAAVDRGKKVKRLGKSSTATKKAALKGGVKKETAKKLGGAKSGGAKKVDKAKVKSKQKEKVKPKKMQNVKSKTVEKSAKKSTKATIKAKQVKKLVVKKKAVKLPVKTKPKKIAGKTKVLTSKAGKKAKTTASRTPAKSKSTKTSGKSASSKVPGKPKVLQAQVKSKVNKISKAKVVSKMTKLATKAKDSKNVKTKSRDIKAKVKDKAKLKSKVSKSKLKSKDSVKKRQSSGAAKKALKEKSSVKSATKNVKPKVTSKSKVAVKPKPSQKAKADQKSKKKPVQSPKKKEVKSPQTSRKRAPSTKSEQKAKITKVEGQKGKVSNSSQAKGENGRLYRENVAGSNYATGPLSSLSWTQWSIFISPTKPKENVDKFISPKGWCSGYCNNELFRSDGIIQAVYEFAVAPPGGTKKYPVFYCATAGSSKINMKECLKNNRMKKEMDRVVKAKGSMYIRRGAFSACNLAKLKETRDYIKDNFNYAWGGNDQQYRKTADIIKDGFIIAKSLK